MQAYRLWLPHALKVGMGAVNRFIIIIIEKFSVNALQNE